MVVVEYTNGFKKSFKKVKDGAFSNRLKSQIKKIVEDPLIGKPTKYDRKGTRELYVSPYRISYAYFGEEGKIVFLSIYHKDNQ